MVQMQKSSKKLLTAIPILAGLLLLVAGLVIADVGMILLGIVVMVVGPILLYLIVNEVEKDQAEKKGNSK